MDLDATLLKGMERVARVIESNATFDYILGERIHRKEYSVLSVDSNGDLVDGTQLRDLFAKRVDNAKPAVYNTSQSDLDSPNLCFAGTANNRREIAFLQQQLSQEAIPAGMVNLCDLATSRISSGSPMVRRSLKNSFAEFLGQRDTVSKGLLHQIIMYSVYALSAYEVLQMSKARTFIVANDHSPGPVAYAMLAGHFGMITVYLQHAEVTKNFPPLDFDFSILRNRASKNIYKEIGPIAGEVLIAARDHESLDLERISRTRECIRMSPKLPAMIYPSGVSTIEDVHSLYQKLASNPRVSAVSVKVHPAVRNLDAYFEKNMRVQRDMPNFPHLAVCGNSSVAIELIAGGNLVYQCFDIDEIAPDYYGFVEEGLAQKVILDEASTPFWLTAPQKQSIVGLAEFLPNVQTGENVLEINKRYRILRQAFEHPAGEERHTHTLLARESLLRDVFVLTSSLLAYARTKSNLYGDDYWVIRTLEEAFANRDPGFNRAYRKIDFSNVESCIEFWLASKAIEWTGRAPSLSDMDGMARFVRSYRSNRRAKSWMESKMFDLIIRFGGPDDMIRLFAHSEYLKASSLGANKKVAFQRFVELNPSWRDRLGTIFNPDLANLSPLEELKLSVQNLKTIDGNLEYSEFRVVEDEFISRHPVLAEEYEALVRGAYRKLAGRTQYMDVLRNATQKQALLAVLKAKLLAKDGYAFIRLGDGEGIIFQQEGSLFTDRDARNRQRHWWGEEVSAPILSSLIEDLRVAVTDSDLLGIPSVYRFLRDHSDRTVSLAQSLQGRGLLSVLQGITEFDTPDKRYTDAAANLALFNNVASIGDLADAAEKLIVVSSGTTAAVTEFFDQFGGATQVQIPTHNKTKHNSKYAATPRPLPYVYRELNKELAGVACPGDLVLVGAGVAGKTFVRTAKQAGAVGLDIGSVMDQYLDAGIHSLF